MKSYQDKPFRRGEKPSERYRQTHPFPTRKESFGKAEYVTNNGVQLRIADGAGSTKDMYYYRVPATKRKGSPKPQMSATVGKRLVFTQVGTRRMFEGEVYRQSGQMYGKGNTGELWIRNIRPLF